MLRHFPAGQPLLYVRELAAGGAPAVDRGTAAFVCRSLLSANIRPRGTYRLQAAVAATRAEVRYSWGMGHGKSACT